jgi:hypothetical protein
MANFDFSRPDMTNSSRTTTIVPQQALFLMNSPMVVDVARQVIQSPDFRTAGIDFKRVQEVYLTVYQRLPRVDKVHGIDEISDAVKFISAEMRKQQEVNTVMKEYAAASQKKAEQRTKTLAESSSAMKEIQNEGIVIPRGPLNPWETFAQALLFSNEASYVN